MLWWSNLAKKYSLVPQKIKFIAFFKNKHQIPGRFKNVFVHTRIHFLSIVLHSPFPFFSKGNWPRKKKTIQEFSHLIPKKTEFFYPAVFYHILALIWKTRNAAQIHQCTSLYRSSISVTHQDGVTDIFHHYFFTQHAHCSTVVLIGIGLCCAWNPQYFLLTTKHWIQYNVIA